MQRDISTCFGAWNMESDSRASLTLFLRAISAEIHLQFGFLSPFLSLHATLKRCALYSTKNYYLINNVAAIKKQRTQKYSNENEKENGSVLAIGALNNIEHCSLWLWHKTPAISTSVCTKAPTKLATTEREQSEKIHIAKRAYIRSTACNQH